MGDNQLYLEIVDEVYAKIEEEKPTSRDDVARVTSQIEDEMIMRVQDTLQEIQNDYCEEKGLVWEDDE